MRLYRARRDRERISIQDQYAILGFISSGTYGKVYKAQPRNPPESNHQDINLSSQSNDLVAIKKFKPGLVSSFLESISFLWSDLSLNIKTSFFLSFFFCENTSTTDREGEVNYTGISQSACREIMVSIHNFSNDFKFQHSTFEPRL